MCEAVVEWLDGNTGVQSDQSTGHVVGNRENLDSGGSVSDVKVKSESIVDSVKEDISGVGTSMKLTCGVVDRVKNESGLEAIVQYNLRGNSGRSGSNYWS